MLYYKSIKERPIGQAVKTTPSHGVNPGSIPGLVSGTGEAACVRLPDGSMIRIASVAQLVEQRIRNA